VHGAAPTGSTIGSAGRGRSAAIAAANTSSGSKHACHMDADLDDHNEPSAVKRRGRQAAVLANATAAAAAASMNPGPCYLLSFDRSSKIKVTPNTCYC
jgi:hypothetical protein